MSVPAWIQEVGTAGSLIAAFGIGAVVAARIARASVFSGFRQKWIDDLRQDMAELVAVTGEIDHDWKGHVASGKLPSGHDPVDYKKLITKVFTIRYRIALRLNGSEVDHLMLLAAIERLVSFQKDEDRSYSIRAAVGATSIVLKREWSVAKYGY